MSVSTTRNEYKTISFMGINDNVSETSFAIIRPNIKPNTADERPLTDTFLIINSNIIINAATMKPMSAPTMLKSASPDCTNEPI